MSQEQKLIDITFEIALTISSDPYLFNRTVEEKAHWIAERLKDCGFDTTPIGNSWGVLKKIPIDNQGRHICPKCGLSMLLFRSLNYKQCTECGSKYDWHLKDGQQSLIQYQR